MDYAKVCVILDLKSTLPEEIKLNIGEDRFVKANIKYEWKPWKCSICHYFGHDVKICGDRTVHLSRS